MICRYLLDRSKLPDRPLVAQVPISTHGQRREIGNQISSMTVSLATNIADPADRMETIYGFSQGAKEMAKVATAQQIMGLTETTPPAGCRSPPSPTRPATSVATRFDRHGGLNVPGPDYPFKWLVQSWSSSRRSDR